jgi:hypothetical protein
MNREIIININEANKAQKYQSKEELFQIEAFERVTEILIDRKFTKDTLEITNCRVHDTIFIDGSRGVGKTAFMINIQHYYNILDKCIDKPQYIFLNPIDPTLLEHTEKFLSVVLGKIVEMVNIKLKNNFLNERKYNVTNDCNKSDLFENTSSYCIEEYYKALENLSKSLSAIKTLDEDIGIEEIASNTSSLKLEQRAHEFFRTVSKMFDVNALVILIDDVDMAFDKGFDVLEVVRKYLASPFLIPIVAGDMKLYKEIIETQFMEKVKFLQDINYLKNLYGDKIIENEIYLEKKELIDNLVEQYIHKVFPSENHIQLDNIYNIVRDNFVTIYFDKDFKVSYNDVKNFEIRHLNIGINQVLFTFEIFTNNARDFIKYLYNKRKIHKYFFETFDKYEFKKSKDIPYNPKFISKEFDNHIIKIIFNLASDIYKESFYKTSIFYKFSNDRKKKELSLLSQNDYEAFSGNQYSLYKAFSNSIFSSLKKLKLDNANDKFAIQRESLSREIKEEDKNFNNISNYIIDLFVFNNYYSSYQSRSYIYAGKFIENIIYSLNKFDVREFISDSMINQVHNYIDINIDFEKLFKKDNLFNLNAEIYTIIYESISDVSSKNNIELQSLYVNAKKLITENFKDKIKEYEIKLKNITNKVPFGSDFSKNKSKYLKESDNSEEEEFNLKISYDLEEYSKDLIIWQNVFLDKVKLNSISMYEIIYKFFRNIEKIKDEFDLRNEKPIIYFRRIVLILINAISYFENNNENVANTNIAMNKNFVFENILSNAPASVNNIQPMLKIRYSLTRALFFHPLISHILFTDEDINSKKDISKLMRLKWQGERNLFKQAERVFNEMTKNIKVFGIDQKIEILSKVLKEKLEIIQEINKIQKFKSSVISNSRDSNSEKQESFKNLQEQFKKIIENA